MMTASPSIVEPITSTTAISAAATRSDGLVTSSISRLYHSIRTSSPRESFSSHTAPSHDAATIMKKLCVDPPGRNSDHEESDNDDGDDGSNAHMDDPTYDWSSISSMDEQDDDFSMAGAAAHQQPIEDTAPPTNARRRRKVTFGMMEVYEVPALSEYRMDDNSSFWYSTMDMISTRRAGRLATMNDISVKNYLHYYEFLYRKLQHHNETYANEELLLSELDAKILAYGLRGGYQGLERESKFELIRQQERRNIVKLIVDVHNSLKLEHAPTLLVSTTSNDMNHHHHQHQQHLDDHDEALRAFAVSLTNTMSRWAAGLGQAAHLAID